LSFEDDQAIIDLDSGELSKFIDNLDFYLKSNDLTSLKMSVDNCLELEESLNNLADSYTDNLVTNLYKIIDYIDKVLDVIPDRTLKALLSENKKQIESYLQRIEKYDDYAKYKQDKEGDYSYYEKVSSPYYKYSKYAKEKARQLAEDSKFKPNTETPEGFRDIALSIRDGFDHVIPDERPDLDYAFSEGLKRLRQRQEEYSKFADKITKQELSYENDPEKYLTEKVIKPLAGRILSEGKEP